MLEPGSTRTVLETVAVAKSSLEVGVSPGTVGHIVVTS
jgi:hypothetical protein